MTQSVPTPTGHVSFIQVNILFFLYQLSNQNVYRFNASIITLSIYNPCFTAILSNISNNKYFIFHQEKYLETVEFIFSQHQ
jgi:hypothetical protein